MASRAFSVATSNITSQLVLGANLNFDAAQSTKISDPGANVLSIFTSSQERVRVDASGNVGIGTSSAAAKLVIEGGTSSDQMRIGNGSNYYKIGRETTSTGYLDFYGTQPGAYGYSFGGIGGTLMVIDGNSGNVGIGTTSPIHKLYVTTGAAGVIANFTDGIAQTIQIKTGSGFAGIENPNAGALTFSNTIERMRIDTAGRVTMPYQPAFIAHGSSGGTSYSGTVVLPYDTVVYNQGSHYNASNYRFTAPVTGTYFFSASFLEFPNASNGTYATLFIAVNGGGYTSSHPMSRATLGSQTTLGCEGLVRLSAGDYVEAKLQGTGDYYLATGHAHFCGYLLG